MNARPLSRGKPLVIAHRGASALRPEHTLVAYARAIEDGADFIEPDLVMSSDGVLVARHENEMGGSTNVAELASFAERKSIKWIDGEKIEGWFCEDFTLAELRQLRAREPMPELRSRAYDDLYPIATFDEIVELAARESQIRGRLIGLLPELKHSSYFRSIGLNLEHALLSALDRHACLQRLPFGVQSFEVANLEELRGLLGRRQENGFLVQLIGVANHVPYDRVAAGKLEHSYAAMMTPVGLARIKTYADAVAVNVRSVLPIDLATGVLCSPTGLVPEAHAAGLQVHVWTLRPENQFLPPALRCSDDLAERCEAGSLIEIRALLDAGIDAFFTDDPGIGRHAVDDAEG